MKLKDRNKYKNNHDDEIYTLHLDYNGLWYLDKRSEDGLVKTRSFDTDRMLNILDGNYIKIKES